jgi:hypothetical protein
MTVFDRRSRTISFRISEKEYENLRVVCQARGIRSISDLARLAAKECVATSGDFSECPLGARVRQLQGQVMQVDGEVKRLARAVEESLECRTSTARERQA